MENKTTILDSGIVLNDIISDNFKTVSLAVEFYLPFDKRTASYASLLSSVLRRGNARFGEMDKIGEFLDENYGASLGISASKRGDLQRFCITAACIDDRFCLEGEPVLSNVMSLVEATLFSPMLENGGFKASFVEQEKRNLKDYIAALINDKRLYSLERCKQTMFADDVYGAYEHGDPEEIDKITPASLYEFMRNMLDNSMLFISYAGASRDTFAFFSGVLQKLDIGKRPVFKTAIDNTPREVNTVIEPMSVAQSKLNIGFRMGNAAMADPFAARVFNAVYGGTATSKLFANVRERLSLCYYCASNVDYQKNVMFVYSGIETENYEKARDEILAQLELVKKGDFTDEELADAKASLVDSYVQIGDSLGSLIAHRVSGELLGISLSREEQIEQIKSITRERVIAIAQDITADTVYLLKGIGGEGDAE